jgi:hypothetical protein
MSDIVDRILNRATCTDSDVDEAAAEIERLRAENETLRKFIHEKRSDLRQWWSFDNNQRHTHSWHQREDFIEGWDKDYHALSNTARKEKINGKA